MLLNLGSAEVEIPLEKRKKKSPSLISITATYGTHQSHPSLISPNTQHVQLRPHAWAHMWHKGQCRWLGDEGKLIPSTKYTCLVAITVFVCRPEFSVRPHWCTSLEVFTYCGHIIYICFANINCFCFTFALQVSYITEAAQGIVYHFLWFFLHPNNEKLQISANSTLVNIASLF